ncbi:MAG: hypothetical protein HBSAPP03_19950 [Phycisphaerae bacterium]|nr:MAG: hypothetical protein HBSAPP03_19950 [Phycisphaerae bacterium]
MSDANLSGKDWWRANQGKYPNSRSVDDLDPAFRDRVERFLASLRDAGASITIASTRRNATRAHLMHYAWRVAYDRFNPADVPPVAGLNIQWDHGDAEASRRGALDMVNLFGMKHIASLTSRHIQGKAIDMTLSWKSVLEVTRPAPLNARIESLPRSGQNRELHELGATVFGVHKLRSDPPHWSIDGK